MTAALARSRPPWPNLLSLLLLAALGFAWYRQPHDLDYCWQIRTGQRILATGEVRQPDSFSFTIAGKDIPDHEWLYESILALIWNNLGYSGLKLVRMILYAAPVAILAWQLRARGVRDHAITIVVLFSLFVLIFFERLRPLVCTTIGLQLVAGWLQDHVHGRRRLDWKLPATMLLWGNLHPAVIMGQALILGALAWHVLEIAFRPAADRLDRSRFVSLIIWGGLGLAASFATPAPIDRLLYPFSSELRHPAQRMFEEIKSPFRHLGHPPYVVEMLLLLAIVFALILWLRRRELFAWEWALFLGVTGLFLVAIRSAGDFLIIGFLLAVPQFGRLLLAGVRSPQWREIARPAVRIENEFKRILNSPLFRLQPIWPAIGLLAIALVSLWPWGERVPNREQPDWPREAADWIAADGLSGPGPWNVFSGYNEGSYLIWRFDGRVKVYSDTRGFYYPGDLLHDSYALPRASGDWRAHLDRVLANGADYFLLQVCGVDGKPYAFWQMLEPHIPNPLYRDEKYVIVSADQVKEAAKAIARGDSP